MRARIMATCFETSTSSFSFFSGAGGDAARTRPEREEAEGETSVVSESRLFFGFWSVAFTYPPVKIKYVTTARPNINNSNQTSERASTATFLTALSIVAYVQERLRAKGA